MKGNELRIGNWVDWNGENGVVSQILEHEVVFKCGEDTLISELKPIELTEEILLKCGFTENKFSYIYEDDTRVSVYVNDNFFFCQIDNVVINNIKFLHQLQNIYFALTNEELTIKL